MTTTIEDRVILLMKDEAGHLGEGDDEPQGMVQRAMSFLGITWLGQVGGGRGFLERLHEYTGISAQRWRKVLARRQRPTPDMLQALGHVFPHHAFWLMTGITDATNGHIAPDIAQAFPERLYCQSEGANHYFRHSLTLARRLFEEAGVDTSDERQRMYAAERTRPLAHWNDTPLADAAYRIAQSQEYAELKELWDAREKARAEDLKHVWPTTSDDRPWVAAHDKAKKSGLTMHPFLGVDSRTAHQDQWDLFYKPTDDHKTQFALSFLNVPPTELTDVQLHALQAWLEHLQDDDLWVFFRYLEHHGIDRDAVIHSKPGMIRYTWRGMTESEIERFVALVRERRDGGRNAPTPVSI